MATHVAHRAGAKVPKPAPLEWMVGGVIRPLLRRPKPQIPVQPLRHRRRTGRAAYALRPDGSIRPDVHLLHVTQHTGLNQLNVPTRVRVGMTLIAHLRGDLVFAREISQHACLENGVRQRFLTVDMFAQPDGHRGGGGMGVIRGGHDHRIDVLGLLFQHLAKVGILRRLGVTLEHMRRPAGIDVTKRDDVLAFAAVDIDLPLAAGTNRSDVEPFVGTEHPPRHHHRERHAGTGHSSSLEKSTTTNLGNLRSCHNKTGCGHPPPRQRRRQAKRLA